MSEPASTAVLNGRLRECDRLLPRPQSIPGDRRPPDESTVTWEEFCDPDRPWLSRCVEEWQERGGFRHHRAATVLVAFRFGWLACCATVPEYHWQVEMPSLAGLRVALGSGGRLSALRPTGALRRPAGTAVPPEQWWQDLSAAFTPLTEALNALGGPAPDSHEYWGNPVGLAATVLWRLERAGMPGDLVGAARELVTATGRSELVRIDAERGRPWVRRSTCCQWWRAGGGYCAECVLQDSPTRQRA